MTYLQDRFNRFNDLTDRLKVAQSAAQDEITDVVYNLQICTNQIVDTVAERDSYSRKTLSLLKRYIIQLEEYLRPTATDFSINQIRRIRDVLDALMEYKEGCNES